MNKERVTLRALKLYHSFNPKYFPISFLNIVFGSISPFFNLWMSAEIVTALFEGRPARFVFTLVAVTLGGNLLIHILNALLGNAVTTQLEILANNESLAFNRKTLSLDYDKLEDPEIRTLRRKIRENGYINNYGIVQLRETVEMLISSFVKVIFSIVFFVEMVVKMASTGFRWPGLAFLVGTVFCVVFQCVWMQKFGKARSKYWMKVSDMMLMENRIGSGVGCNGMDSRIYHQSDMICKLEDQINKDHLKAFSAGERFDFKMGVPDSVFSWTSLLFNYLLVGYYCILGAFPIGGVIKYTGYINRFMVNFTTLIAVPTRFFKENKPFLSLYLEYFNIPNDMYQGSLSVEKRSDRKYDVEFRNVSFKYPASDEYALRNVNFQFKVGERLAVVGMNGSGKTTLIKLLCRLYDPTEGEVFMNDFNVRKFDYRQYLDLFSVVFQDYSLLALPIGNNISSTQTWDTEKAEQLLEKVGFGSRLSEMPKQLETPLYKNFDDDGVNVSGGEAQKIALARALYKDAPFIILDEPTAALDPLAEAEIYSRFNEIAGDKTVIYISHRLSSCRFCDRILVLDHGEVVQYGTHDELLADENGKYSELWNAQAQYYTSR